MRGSGLDLCERLAYLDFLRLFPATRVVLTESGRIQEETTMIGVRASRCDTTTEGRSRIPPARTFRRVAFAGKPPRPTKRPLPGSGTRAVCRKGGGHPAAAIWLVERWASTSTPENRQTEPAQERNRRHRHVRDIAGSGSRRAAMSARSGRCGLRRTAGPTGRVLVRPGGQCALGIVGWPSSPVGRWAPAGCVDPSGCGICYNARSTTTSNADSAARARTHSTRRIRGPPCLRRMVGGPRSDSRSSMSW